MNFVSVLKDEIKDRKIGDPDRWIKEWLFTNSLNSGRSIPHNAPVTLIVGLQMLFEFPYQAITVILNDMTRESLAPYICVSDAEPTEVLIVDMTTRKIVFFQKHDAWKFRFKNLKTLETWMRDKAVEIAKAMGREAVWQKLLQK